MSLLREAIEERGKDITDSKNWLGVWTIINIGLLEDRSYTEIKKAILEVVLKILDEERKHLRDEGII